MNYRDRLIELRRVPAEELKRHAVTKPRKPGKATELNIPESYELVVTCRDENDQRQLYERLAAEGYECRVLTM